MPNSLTVTKALFPQTVDQYTKLTPYSSFYESDEETLKLYPNDVIKQNILY